MGGIWPSAAAVCALCTLAGAPGWPGALSLGRPGKPLLRPAAAAAWVEKCRIVITVPCTCTQIATYGCRGITWCWVSASCRHAPKTRGPLRDLLLVKPSLARVLHIQRSLDGHCLPKQVDRNSFVWALQICVNEKNNCSHTWFARMSARKFLVVLRAAESPCTATLQAKTRRKDAYAVAYRTEFARRDLAARTCMTD
jgi:hypothetical protein